MPATRDQVADVFQRHVERYGYAKTTVEDVAAELGISKKTVYEYFAGKRDIYAYVIDRMAEGSRAQMRAAIEALPTWSAKLEAVMGMVLGAARRHIAETAEGDWRQEYEVAGEAFTTAMSDVIGEVVAGGVSAGEFTFPDATVATRLLRAMALDYVLVVREDQRVDVDEALVHAVRRFLGD